uniref:Uncharacterized protein n=1 Tax=Arundo donax TaxID=35708 RepID=A0A0A9GX34_ARUDO
MICGGRLVGAGMGCGEAMLLNVEDVLQRRGRPAGACVTLRRNQSLSSRRGSFCIRCKVPWHDRMTCYDYKRYPHAHPEDVKLQNLAQERLWRQCVRCKHMIELAEIATI